MSRDNNADYSSNDGVPMQWKSLAQVSSSRTEEFVSSEFQAAWEEADTGHARRDFLRVMGASIGLAGLSACVRQPEEKIVPYVKQPENLVPGKPRYYATSFERGGYGHGVLAESHAGRPTHLEGNKDHPASLGGMDPIAQASVLQLWDPERSKSVRRGSQIATWGVFAEDVLPKFNALREKKGVGLHILTKNVSSPTLAAKLKEVLTALPNAKWHQWEAANRDNVRQGTISAFGEALEVSYAFENAKVIVTLDADLVTEFPGNTRYARNVFARRANGQNANRLYAFESYPSSTGSLADHRIPLKAHSMGALLRDLAKALGIAGAVAGNSGVDEKIIKNLAQELLAAKGHAVVVPGDHLPSGVHAIAHAINEHIRAKGTVVKLTRPVYENSADNFKSISELSKSLEKGEVELLIMLDTNPVYDAPAKLGFDKLLEKAKTRVHVGQYYNESARVSHWHLPLSHYLESWGDVRAFDGTASVVQPLIAPLYDTKSSAEIVSFILGDTKASTHQLLKNYWRGERGGLDFEAFWRKVLHDGTVAKTAFAEKHPPLLSSAIKTNAPDVTEGLELVLRPCPNIWDGAGANNSWLQEQPRPLTRISWDNAVFLSPATAKKLGVKNEDLVKVSVGETSVTGPVWVLPGVATDSVTIHLGYGRDVSKVSKGAGFNVYPLRSSADRIVADVSIAKTGKTYKIACVQDHNSMEDRPHVRHATQVGYKAHKNFATAPDKKVLPISMYPEFDYSKGHAWAMTIDLGACTGCNACMVACQSENNIAVVGKDQVGKGREMHWIRVDRYFEGDPENPQIYHQPVNCMHCELAPCEPVCPANATVHGPEGLNQMVYNRCIGTRYCSNNCPYKVRRFNFLLYSDFETESLKGQRNPDVTVRGRGVMEKCSYCVQRINTGKFEASLKKVDVKDGDVVTACQAACPTDAIVFGDKNDKHAKVTKLRSSALNYELLKELNTKPRTTYLARVTNPNESITPTKIKKSHGHHDDHGKAKGHHDDHGKAKHDDHGKGHHNDHGKGHGHGNEG